MKPIVWIVFISLVFVKVAICDDWQGYKESMKEGNQAAQGILDELGSPEKIEDRISSPVANPDKPFATFGPEREKQTFSAAVFENTNTYKLTVQALRRNDGTFAGTTVTVRPSGKSDRTYIFDQPISGVCANGFVTRTPEIRRWLWQVSGGLNVHVVRVKEPQVGCICITYDCGMGKSTDKVLLEKLAAGIVAALQTKVPSLAIVESKSSQNSVSFVLSQTSSHTKANPEYNPKDDSSLEDQVQYERYKAKQDSNSVYSILSDTHVDYHSPQMKSDVQRADKTAWSAQLTSGGFSYQSQGKDGQWGIQKYALPLMPDAKECEKVCKISRPVTDTAMTSAGQTVSSIRRSGASSAETIFRVCEQNVCPVSTGETIVRECACKSDFKEIAAAMQMFDAAGKDIICSKK